MRKFLPLLLVAALWTLPAWGEVGAGNPVPGVDPGSSDRLRPLSGCDSLYEALGAIAPGVPLRVQLRLSDLAGPFVSDSARLLEGPFLSRADSELVIHREGLETGIPCNHIETLWALGNDAKKGMAIGGVTLGTLGVVSGLVLVGISSIRFEPGPPPPGAVAYVGAAVLGGTLGAGVGITVGGLAGSLFPAWQQRFP